MARNYIKAKEICEKYNLEISARDMGYLKNMRVIDGIRHARGLNVEEQSVLRFHDFVFGTKYAKETKIFEHFEILKQKLSEVFNSFIKEVLQQLTLNKLTHTNN